MPGITLFHLHVVWKLLVMETFGLYAYIPRYIISYPATYRVFFIRTLASQMPYTLYRPCVSVVSCHVILCMRSYICDMLLTCLMLAQAR
ncbi:hypothetical protein F4808DRAFT_331050 [Astrocystis sublimbata]|nr:hypothetical protein F4808DRAFT_331050 [Astrocystis sublimbata]